MYSQIRRCSRESPRAHEPKKKHSVHGGDDDDRAARDRLDAHARGGREPVARRRGQAERARDALDEAAARGAVKVGELPVDEPQRELDVRAADRAVRRDL